MNLPEPLAVLGRPLLYKSPCARVLMYGPGLVQLPALHPLPPVFIAYAYIWVVALLTTTRASPAPNAANVISQALLRDSSY